MPGICAVWLCRYLPLRVFHQGLHDSSRVADPHLRAQVRLRLDSPILHRALSYRLCKWVLWTGAFPAPPPPVTTTLQASLPPMQGKEGLREKERVEGGGIRLSAPLPAQHTYAAAIVFPIQYYLSPCLLVSN